MVILDEVQAALSAVPTDGSRVSKLRRNSLLAFREKFVSTVPPLRVQLGSDTQISATDLSTITKALQDATARSAMLILHPNEDRIRVSSDIRGRAELIPRSQSGNVLYFDFPAVTVSGNELPTGRITHLAERAVLELIQVMPENDADQASIEALPSRRVGLRSAVQTLARAVTATESLSITLSRRGAEEGHSVLTNQQALEIPELLSGTTTETREIPVRGLMDGMRTLRRLFYINDDEHAKEYQGSIESDQIPAVQAAMGRIVDARLKETVTVRADGSRSHASFSLMHLEVSPDL